VIGGHRIDHPIDGLTAFLFFYFPVPYRYSRLDDGGLNNQRGDMRFLSPRLDYMTPHGGFDAEQNDPEFGLDSTGDHNWRPVYRKAIYSVADFACAVIAFHSWLRETFCACLIQFGKKSG